MSNRDLHRAPPALRRASAYGETGGEGRLGNTFEVGGNSADLMQVGPLIEPNG